MPNIGPMELAVVVIIALVIFGPKKLPELGNSLGKGMREFKSSISGDEDHKSEEASQQRLEATADDATDEDEREERSLTTDPTPTPTPTAV